MDDRSEAGIPRAHPGPSLLTINRFGYDNLSQVEAYVEVRLANQPSQPIPIFLRILGVSLYWVRSQAG